jgi:hypothetical protein
VTHARYRTLCNCQGCFACILGGADKRTLFLMANEWRGPASMADGPRMGQVLTLRRPHRAVGHKGVSTRASSSWNSFVEVSFHDAVLEVSDVGRFDDADGLQLDVGARDVVEEPGAVAEHDGNDVELQLVD